jgi:thymidylate synthase
MSPSQTPTNASAIGIFETAQEAWVSSLARLRSDGCKVKGVTDPYSVGSGFGTKDRPTQELLAASFTILNPRRRLFTSRARPIDLGYAFANVVWTLTGSNDLETISAYNPRGRFFSDDGETLFGAPGYRIFHSAAGDQFELAIGQLKSDLSSRRAMIQLLTPVDLAASTRDHSCIVDLQFLIRESKLTCIAHMRSQSTLMVMPYDLILLTMIHEAMASSLQIEIGSYHHFCGSLHYYLDEEDSVDRAIHEVIAPPSAMPVMPSFGPPTRKILSAAAKDIREAMRTDQRLRPQQGIEQYWTDILRVITVGFLVGKGSGSTEAMLADIPQIYRMSLIRHTI